MPYVNLNGKLVEVTQEQYDIYTIGQNVNASTAAVKTSVSNIAAGGTVTQSNTATDTILTPNTTNTSPGQTLETTSAKAVTTADTTLTTQINNVAIAESGGVVPVAAPATQLQTQINDVATVQAGGTVEVPKPVTELQTQIQNVDTAIKANEGTTTVAGSSTGGYPGADITTLDPAPVRTSAVPLNGNAIGLGAAYDEDGNLNPGYTLDENNNPVYVGGNFVEPATANLAAAGRESARQQQIRADQRRMANTGDWRVRLQLAQSATYLYKDPGLNQQGILWPLQISDGVIFPYTPSITTNYRATYSQYDLTHSNYRGYFYQNSFVDAIQLSATFTAQDTADANYLLAVIHFFRSVTKMFYGQDAERGTPPPLVFLSGLGEFQFNGHACLVQNFNYTLPADVDYIRARSPNQIGLNLSSVRTNRQSVASSLPIFGPYNRLAAAFLNKGGTAQQPSAPKDLGLKNPTYVPTKIDIQLTLLPVQSRQQVSKQFSLKDFANGDLIRRGFW